MKKTFHTLLFAALLMPCPFAFAQAPGSVDAGQFDVAGVKLGMGRDEAIAAITAKLQIPQSAVQLELSPQVNPVTKTRQAKYFSVKTPGASIIVHFEPRIPLEPNNPMSVSLVVYEQPWTPQNVEAMKAAALEKYGQPSNGKLGVSWDWCLQPNNRSGSGCFDFNGPKLQLAGPKLQLTDPTYTQARIDFMNKAQSAKPTF